MLRVCMEGGSRWPRSPKVPAWPVSKSSFRNVIIKRQRASLLITKHNLEDAGNLETQYHRESLPAHHVWGLMASTFCLSFPTEEFADILSFIRRPLFLWKEPLGTAEAWCRATLVFDLHPPPNPVCRGITLGSTLPRPLEHFHQQLGSVTCQRLKQTTTTNQALGVSARRKVQRALYWVQSVLIGFKGTLFV